MHCPTCQQPMRRCGKNRSGSQRFRCDSCRKTITDKATLLLDHRRVAEEKMILCLRMLLEGNSIRSVERLTGVHRDTIIDAMVTLGGKCERFLGTVINGIPVANVQADEIWGFVFCKEKARLLRKYPEEGCGDAYCYTAIERSTKLLIAWHLGKRCDADTWEFAEKLRRATTGRFQLTTDGFHPYRTAVPGTFGTSLDYAVLVKDYHATPEESRRYSPPEVVKVTVRMQTGDPDETQICTSHVERHNRTLRMQIRRLTRLTDAHSKKWENHEAALGLFFAYYNFCRVHITLNEAARDEGSPVRKVTPAMAAGLTDHVWSVKELVEKAAA
jgi:transposase-like protein/IS1 family transposase